MNPRTAFEQLVQKIRWGAIFYIEKLNSTYKIKSTIDRKKKDKEK